MGAIPTNKVAFVTGANGISGYSIIEHLVPQPKQQWYGHPIQRQLVFHKLPKMLTTCNRSKIIVTSRRSLPNAWIDPRVEFVAVDFLDPVENIIAKLKDICADTTHAFFTSYVHNDDFKLLRDQNVPLFRNFLDAVDTVCPKLQRVCLQTGGKVRV
jgi:nucleoside-diphosphate-sugar epimerase